jgi:tellurite resistance protein
MSDIANALDGMGEVQQALADERAAQADAEGMAILGAMVEAAYIVAVSDGALSEAETQTLTEGFVNLTDGDVDAETIAGMLEYAGEGLEAEGQTARFESIARTLEDEALRDGVFVVASAVAWKDGGIGAKQGGAIRALGKAFGYSENKHQTLLAKGRAG